MSLMSETSKETQHGHGFILTCYILFSCLMFCKSDARLVKFLQFVQTGDSYTLRCNKDAINGDVPTGRYKIMITGLQIKRNNQSLASCVNNNYDKDTKSTLTTYNTTAVHWKASCSGLTNRFQKVLNWELFDLTVTFTSVTAADEGIYECVVDFLVNFAGAGATIYLAHIFVQAPLSQAGDKHQQLPKNNPCGRKWKYYSSSNLCLRVYKEKMTMTAALQYCIDLGVTDAAKGSLVKPNNAALDAFVSEMISDDKLGNISVWIGMIHRGGSDLWMDGTPHVEYINWADNQFPSGGTDMHCAVKGQTLQGTWSGVDCSEEHGFVCQVKASYARTVKKRKGEINVNVVTIVFSTVTLITLLIVCLGIAYSDKIQEHLWTMDMGYYYPAEEYIDDSVYQTTEFTGIDKESVHDTKSDDETTDTIGDTISTDVDDINTVVTVKNTVVSDKNTVVSDKNTVVRDKNTVVSDKNSVVGDKNTVVSDKNTVLSDKNTVGSNRNSTIGVKNTVVDDKNTIVSDKNTVGSNRNSTIGMERKRSTL